MTKRNKWVKIMAFLALFWIIIWIVWTGLLIIFSDETSYQQEDISTQDYLDLQELIDTNSWNIVIENTPSETLTWETE
jgi:hypothetical protein